MGYGWRKAAKCWPKLHIETLKQNIETLKPSTKARPLQFCKTEIKTDIGGEKLYIRRLFLCYREISDGYMVYLLTEETSAITQNRSSRERVKDSFTRLIYSCQCHFIHVYVYMYFCIYNFLWIILIPSLWSELLLRYVGRA